MSAVITRRIRTGGYHYAVGTEELYRPAAEPDLYGHVTRVGLRHQWLITAGRSGEVLRAGRAFTRGGAWVKAIAAAHQPGLGAA